MASVSRTARAAAREVRSRSIPATIDAPSTRVVWALTRVEGRRMLRHPAYPIGLGFGFLLVGIPRGGDVNIGLLLLGIGMSLVIGSLFAANLGALRSRRDGTDELFGSAPAPLAARTASLLGGVWLGPVVASTVWAVVVGLMAQADVGGLPEDLRLSMLLQAPLMVAAIGSLGVMTARVVPHVVGAAIVLALHMFTGLIWALPWAVFEEDLSTNLWHLGYLAAAIVVFSSVAFLRDRVRVLPVVTAAIGLGAAIVCGVQRIPDGGW